MTTHAELEGLAAAYAAAVAQRRERVMELRRRLFDAAADLLPALRAAAAAERDGRETLLSAVTDSPDLFARPRTRNAHGIKYGWQTGKASIDIPDEARTLKLIRTKLPPEQQELLIRVREAVERRAVLDLTAQDLRRLAIIQVPGVDAPLVSLPKDATDKLVDTLIAESAGEEQP